MSNQKATSEAQFFPNSKKVYVSGKQYPDLRVPLREITLEVSNTANESNGSQNGDNPANQLRVYDTSGPWGDEQEFCDVRQGLKPLRSGWIHDRGDVERYPHRKD